jgi:hypothetical protein
MTILVLYYFSMAFYIRLQPFVVNYSTTHIPSSHYSSVTFQRSYSQLSWLRINGLAVIRIPRSRRFLRTFGYQA